MFDLTVVTALDSTVLGLIARTGEWMLQHRREAMSVLCTGDRILATLRGVGLHHVVTIVSTAAGAGGQMEELPNAPVSRQERTRTILAAHRELMSLSEQNGAQFKNVVELLEREAQLVGDFLAADDAGEPAVGQHAQKPAVTLGEYRLHGRERCGAIERVGVVHEIDQANLFALRGHEPTLRPDGCILNPAWRRHAFVTLPSRLRV